MVAWEAEPAKRMSFSVWRLPRPSCSCPRARPELIPLCPEPQLELRTHEALPVLQAKINRGDASKSHGKREQSIFICESPVLGCVSKGRYSYLTIAFLGNTSTLSFSGRKLLSPYGADTTLTPLFSGSISPPFKPQTKQTKTIEANKTGGSEDCPAREGFRHCYQFGVKALPIARLEGGRGKPRRGVTHRV